MRYILLTSLVILSACGPRGAISSACLEADRSAASPRLCGCVQQVANDTLSRADQRKAAKFFADPERAQDMRRSDSSAANAFWKRYKAFTSAAAQRCG